MNEIRVWITLLFMLQLGCSLSFGRYISSLGPIYRKIIPISNPAADLTRKSKQATVFPIQQMIDQESGDFSLQTSVETTLVQTTFIVITSAANPVDENVASENVSSQSVRSLELESSGDLESQSFDSSITGQQELASLKNKKEITTEVFNASATWISRPMPTFYPTAQNRKDDRQLDISTIITSNSSQTNFSDFVFAIQSSPPATILTEFTKVLLEKTNNTVIATRQNSSREILLQQNTSILKNKNASQTHTGFCKTMATLSSRLFKHYSIINTSIVEQRINISFYLNTASSRYFDKYIFIDNHPSTESDCYVPYRILKGSELELQSILGILKYGSPIRIKNQTVVIELVADFGFGKKNKASLLRAVYLDVVASDLSTDGITIRNFTMDVEIKNMSALCMSTPCNVGTRCEIRESPNQRWRECVSSCHDSTYCFNNGICQLNLIGNQTCWCPSGAAWWLRGERCEKMENITVIAIAAGSSGLLIMVLFLVFIAWITRRKSKSTNEQHQSHRTRKRRDVALKTNLTTVRDHNQPSYIASNARVEEESGQTSQAWNPTFGNDHKMHKILRSIRNPQIEEMVQATSFKSIHSHGRACLSNLHGKMQRSASVTTRLSNGWDERS